MTCVRDPFKWGMQQAQKYFLFLCKVTKDDVEQEVKLVCLCFNPNTHPREFQREISKSLYHLAKSLGYRKANVMDKINTQHKGWYKVTIQYPLNGRFV